MTNERIDLSQYDGITEGKWEVIDTPGGGIDVGVKHSHNSHSPVITFTQRLADMVRKSERDTADLQAIADIPILIAELERCYEMVDPIRGQVIYGIRHSPVNGKLEKFTTDTKGVLRDVNSGAGFGDMEYLYLTEVERDTSFDEMASE